MTPEIPRRGVYEAQVLQLLSPGEGTPEGEWQQTNNEEDRGAPWVPVPTSLGGLEAPTDIPAQLCPLCNSSSSGCVSEKRFF
jgi:hypothetical protein